MVIRYTKPPSQRQLKVAEEIRHALSEVFIRNELSHPFFEKNIFHVSVVRISQDLKLATAFISVPKGLNEKELLDFFNELSAVFRKLVSKKILLRYMPKLQFAVDASIATAIEVEEILQSIK